MPIQIQADAGIIRITFSGNFTKAEIVELFRDLERLEAQFEHIPDRLTDLSGVGERETNFEAIWSVAYERTNRIFPNKFRSAIVAPDSMSLGFARIFQSLNSNPQIEIRIFSSKAEAESWLASNV